MFHRNILTAAVLATLCDSGLAADLVELAAVPGVKNAADTLVGAAPTAAETAARKIQKWLLQIKSPYANQLGSGNGTGVTVGIVDSGAQADHPLLEGQFAGKYNPFNNTEDITDQIGHGTHVSGLVAGTMVNGALQQGVAPGARLAMAKAFTTGTCDTVVIGKGIDWVVNVQKAPILSLSLGSVGLALTTPIKNAVADGTLITATLGNNGKTNAANWPAEFAKESWANGQIIAVGAVDDYNKRARFSNYDPTLAKWTVCAPGVNVASSYSSSALKNAYVFMSGTSRATPIVAGQAALIKSNWNFLAASDIAQVIFLYNGPQSMEAST